MESKGKISFGFKKTVPSIGGNASVDIASSSKLPIKSSLFDDEEEVEVKKDPEKKKKNGKGTIYTGVAGAAPLSRSAKQRTEEALHVDASVFDYDGVYDSMKIGEKEAAERREEEKKKREPKYIAASIASSEQRKIDRTRAEAKMIQREREAEGEDFAGTEAFVTDAYKQQMMEIREAELKEKEKEEEERVKSKGVAGFYKKLREENDRIHQAAVAASLQVKPVEEVEKAKLSIGEQEEENRGVGEMAKLRAVEEARKKGLDVRLNDDNEVVDERSLLSAGLNTFGKKKREEAEERRGEQSRRNPDEFGSSEKRDGAREAREAREAQRRRQTKMIEEQMLELEKKREQEAQEEEEKLRKSLVKDRRNDESSVANARERALERKRKREEELQQQQS